MFKFRYGSECDNSKPCSSNKGRARIHSIVKASKIYRDDLHVELEKQVEEDENLTVYFQLCFTLHVLIKHGQTYTRAFECQ